MKSMPTLIFLVLLASPGFSQTTTSDSQTQQQILDELRAIHREMRANTTLQLLIAELQVTETSLEHATQKRDGLKAQDTQLQIAKTSAQADVTRFEDGMDKLTAPDQQFVDRLNQLKDHLRDLIALETATSAQLQDAESGVRAAQTEQENVQGQLNDLVKKLGSVN